MDLLESFLFTILNALACWDSEPFKLRYPKVQVNLFDIGHYEVKSTSSKPIKSVSFSDEITHSATPKSPSLDSFSNDSESPTTQDFNFDKWIKGEGLAPTYSYNNVSKGKVSWNMLISNVNSLNVKVKKPSPSSSLVSKKTSVTPPSFNTPIPVPELFDVKRCCPSYFFSEQQRQILYSQGWFKDELPLTLNDLNSFNEEKGLSQSNSFLTKHLQDYKNYKNHIEKKSNFIFETIGTLAQAQIIYRYYVEILYPSFSKNLHVITYMNISCHRLLSLLKDLVIAPQDFKKNTKKMEHFLHSLNKVNPKACLFLFHYLSSIILDFIEIPEENYTDESVWRKVALWLYNLQPKQSDLVLKTHFIQRCPRILEQTFKFPEGLDKKQTQLRHGFRSSSHLLRLQELLLTSSPESNISSESSNESLEEEVPIIITKTKESPKNKELLNLNINTDIKYKLKTPLPDFPDFEDIEISDAEDLIIDDTSSPMLSGICLSDAEFISKESRLLSNTSDSSPHLNNDKSSLNSNSVCFKDSTDVKDNEISSIDIDDKINVNDNKKSIISDTTKNQIEDSIQGPKDNDSTTLAPISTIESKKSIESQGIVGKSGLHDSSNRNNDLVEGDKNTHVPEIVHTTHFLDSSSIPGVGSNQSLDDDISNNNDSVSVSSSSEENNNESLKSHTSYPSFPNIFNTPEISEDFEFESDDVYAGRMERLVKAYMFIEGLRLLNRSD